jgi:hypothetical protein
MKTSPYISLTGPRGERGWGMFPHPSPRLPIGVEFFPVYIPAGGEPSPSPSPNGGIPRGESGIGAPLPSLAMAQEVHGPEYDPSTEPIDPDVLMRVGGGKRHGRYWISDGAINSSSTPTLSQVRARSTGSSTAIRPRHDSSQHRMQQLEVSASVTCPSLSYIPSL